MKLLLAIIVSILFFLSFFYGQSEATEITCEPLLKAGHFNTTAKNIFAKQLGWRRTGWLLSCAGDDRENCLSYIEERFMKMTDNFNLTTRDEGNITLGQAFCNQFPNVPPSKLMIGKSFICTSSNAAYKDQAFTEIYSKQKLTCISGKAFITDASSLVIAKSGTIFSILFFSSILAVRCI